jgi:hypothetical protein
VSNLRVRIHPQVRFVEKEGAAVLLQLDRGRYQSLNSSGLTIWGDIGSDTTVDDLVTGMCRRHPGVARQRIDDDVRKFLTQLQARGVVTLEAAP